MCAYMMVGHTNKVKNGKMDVTTTVSVMTAWQENTHVQKGKLIGSNNIIPVPQHKLVKLSQFWRGFTHTYKSRTLENCYRYQVNYNTFRLSKFYNSSFYTHHFCFYRCASFPLVPPECKLQRDPNDICCFLPVCNYNQTSPAVPNLLSPSPGVPTLPPCK